MTFDQTAGDIIQTPGATSPTAAVLSGDPLIDQSVAPAAGAKTAPLPAGFDPQFGSKLNAMIAASGGRLRIVSGFRSHAQQQALWDEAVKRYGEIGARKWVAPPGHSNHEHGVAADLGGDLALAHKLAPQFGLVFPMPWEDWHVEPAGARTNPNAYTVPPPGYPDPTSAAAQATTQSHLASLVAGLSHLDPQDRAAAKTDLTTPTAGTGAPATTAPAPAAAGPIAPPTAPSAPTPSAGTTADVIAPSTSQGDTAKLIAGQPITDAASNAAATPEQVNAAAGQAGVVGNPSGVGHIQSTPEREAFARAIFAKLGVPDTPENLRALIAWQQGEGTSAAFNPLATTDHAPGSTAFNDNNGTPVQNFTSFEQGVDTTVQTLMNGRYGNILSALQQGNSAVAVAQAIAASPWGTGALVLKILGAG